jgi:two-component system response regulator
MTPERTILLVEDNSDDAALTLRALQKSEIRNPVQVASDGQEALDWLAQQTLESEPRLPSLILLDLNMPRMDGFETLHRIRMNHKTRHVPVVVLTSSREDTDLVRAYALGANSYIRKPVDFREFVEVTRQIGRYWLVLNELPSSRAVAGLNTLGVQNPQNP